MRWCSTLPPHGGLHEPPLAAIGILSTPERHSFRGVLRNTWLQHMPASLSPWFVLRGVGLPADSPLLAEASFADVVLVEAAANASRAVGPLHSLFLWFRCAVDIFSETRFISKLDDDVWLYPNGVAALLRSLLPLIGDTADELYIGSFEGYHWDELDGRPVGWSGKFPMTVGCVRRTPSGRKALNGSVAGPFSFAKGPALFLSAGLVRLLVRDPTADPRCLPGSRTFWAEGTVALGSDGRAAATRCNFSLAANPRAIRRPTLPWEDVWLGYLLSQLRPGAPSPLQPTPLRRVVVVHLSSDLTHDEWGFRSKATALWWHSRTDDSIGSRMPKLNHYMRQHACPAPANLSIGTHSHKAACSGKHRDFAGTPYTTLSCAGLPWLVCRQGRGLFGPGKRGRAGNCTSAQVDLLRLVQ